MNNSELIECYKLELQSIDGMIEANKYYNKQIGGHDGLLLEYGCRKELAESTISALSATIPRETAKCKPTEEDEYVIAFDRDIDLWELHTAYVTANNPETYPFWLPMPAAPEDPV
jgi:hypothetical protein